MKIIHIVRMNNEGDIGGVEYHVKYLSQSQLSQGLTPIIVTVHLTDHEDVTISMKNGIQWYDVKIQKKKSIFNLYEKLKKYEGKGVGLFIMLMERIQYNFYSKKIIKIINGLSPNIIHQHDYLPSVYLSRKLSKLYPIIFTNHFGEYLYLEKFFITRLLQRYFISPFDKIIAPSKELLPKTKNSHHITNGYNHKVFYPIDTQQQIALKRSFSAENKVIFLCARRWAPTKGIIYLAEAINQLEKEVRKKCIFLFAGNESTDYELYKHQVSNELKRATDCDIRLLGNLDHKKLLGYIQMCDIAVIPSLMEAISLFAVESLGSGKPVLATKTGGLPEIIKSDHNGWLIPKGDSTALANIISDIVNQYPESIPEIDVAFYKNNYSWDSISERVTALYNQISNNRHEKK